MQHEAQAAEAEQDQGTTPVTDPAPVVLPGPARWLGTRGGYSADDLVSLQVAYERFEVSRPDPRVPHNEVLELRIHGVGGASAESNLETPTTLMVAGDKKAGFYRAWFPGQGQAHAPLREAYCWGRFSYTAITSAVWSLLLPFALVNLASWALPSPHRVGQATELGDWRWARRVARVLLRLLGVVLTAAFMITLCYLLVVIVARQAADDKTLPGWLDWYEGWEPTHRVALALGIAVAVLIGLRIFSGYTTGKYEDWSPGKELSAPTTMRLSEPDMWRGSETVRRQQFCHVFTALAVVLAFTALALPDGDPLADLGLAVAVIMVSLALLVLVVPGCDRLWSTQEQAPSPEHAERHDQSATPRVSGWSWALPQAVQRLLAGLAWVVTTMGVVYVWFRGSDAQNRTFAVESWLLNAPVLTEFVVLVLLAGVLVVQKPWQQVDVFAAGFLSVLVAGLAVAVSSIFGGALLLTATSVFSSPSIDSDTTGKKETLLPGVVTAGSLAFLATMVAALCVAGYLASWRARLKKRLVTITEAELAQRLPAHPPADETAHVTGTGSSTPWKPRDIPVLQEYQEAGLAPPHAAAYDRSVKAVAGIWSMSRMTDLTARVGAAVAIPTLLVLLLADILDPTAPWVLNTARIGSAATVAATIGFIGFLRSALVSEAQRRKFAFFWDVVNFWPRQAHPFAPPCYAERVVPEVTTRIRRIVGDVSRGPWDPAVGQVASERDPERTDGGFEPHRAVVLNGYSQGSPISVAVMAQLPGDTHELVALLTLACPAHRLYGRAFPLYFGPDQLEALLNERLTNAFDGTRRWINMCRRSDYVGGPVGMGIDEWILDPPALWPSTNMTQVPSHLHSDWFPDPQTHPNVDVLAQRLPRLPDPRTADPDKP